MQFAYSRLLLSQNVYKKVPVSIYEGVKLFVFVSCFVLHNCCAVAQAFLLFNNNDLHRYDTSDCEDGQIYLLDYKTAFECQDNRVVLRKGFIPYGMVADAIRSYVFRQIDAGIDTGSQKWSVCEFKWRNERGIKRIEIECPDSIKWIKVCGGDVNCGNLRCENIYSKELLKLDSHRIYIRSMDEVGWIYALVLKQEENDPFKYSGKLAIYINGESVFEGPISFTIPDSVYPDLLDVPILSKYDTALDFFKFLIPLNSGIGVLRCQGGKCQWTNVVRTTSFPYIVGGLSEKFVVYFDDGKLKVVNMNKKTVQIIDSFSNYLYLYLTASPRSYYWCDWCNDYKLWILDPFSTVLYRYKFEEGKNVVFASKEHYVLDSIIHMRYLHDPSQIDSIYRRIKAMCDAEDETENATQGSMFIKGVLADSMLWVSAERVSYPCEKYAFPEEIYFDEIFVINGSELDRYYLIRDEACLEALIDSIVDLDTEAMFTMDIVPMYCKGNSIEVYTSNTLESVMKGSAGILRKFTIIFKMRR